MFLTVSTVVQISIIEHIILQCRATRAATDLSGVVVLSAAFSLDPF